MNPYISLPLTILLLLRAYLRQSLTPLGLLTAGLTATIHSLHPSTLPFTLLGVFFLAGTTASHVHRSRKATLTLSSTGSTPEGPRTHIQVLANSGVASFLVLLYVWRNGVHYSPSSPSSPQTCIGIGNDLLLSGIIAQYAAVCADTLSSELGILSPSPPVLITTLQPVPPGTNGGVTPTGLLAGLAGGAIIALASLAVGTFCPPETAKLSWAATTSALGLTGSILDSLLGAVLQASVIDRRTGKIVEGDGGVKVLLTSARSVSRSSAAGTTTTTRRQRGDAEGTRADTSSSSSSLAAEKHGQQQGGRVLGSGRDILDNNQINVLMAATMGVTGMIAARTVW